MTPGQPELLPLFSSKKVRKNLKTADGAIQDKNVWTQKTTHFLTLQGLSDALGALR